MEKVQEKSKPKRINELKGLEKIEMKTVCRSCGQIHFVEKDPEKDNIRSFINKWSALCAWLINQKCKCASPFTMELFINEKTTIEFWEYINNEVFEDIPEMEIPKTKSEAIKYFVSECKNCLEWRQEYLENAKLKGRIDLVEQHSPLACSVQKGKIVFYEKTGHFSSFEITNYEYDKLFKAFGKGVILDN